MTHNAPIKMFTQSDRPRLFYCQPGQDFAASVVSGLRSRLEALPPPAMSRVKIYANAERMRAQIVEEFHKDGPVFLPKVRLITDLPGDYPVFGEPSPVSAMQRMLELRQLVAQLVRSNKLVAHRSAVPDLADTLTSLIEEMSDEGVAPDAFDNLDIVEHSGYWELSLKFLNIVTQFIGPTSQERPGQAEWFRRAASSVVAHWKVNPEPDPVLIVGSTGSRGTTAMLIRAVASLPQGAAILPGFDTDTPQQVLSDLIGNHRSEDHPQYRFAQLLSDLDLAKSDLRAWHGHTSPSQTARNSLVSLSLRPAPVTSQWMTEAPKLTDLENATKNVSLILAPDPRREALAISLAMREAVENDRTVALVTPDKDLTRMVVTALARWNIVPDASIGQPLDQSVPGRVFRQALKMFPGPPETEVFLSLMKHPLVSSGANRGEHLNWTRQLELRLREKAVPFIEPHHVTAWLDRQTDPKPKEWVAWVCEFVLQSGMSEADRLETYLQRHVTFVEGLCAGYVEAASPDAFWLEDAGEAMRDFVQELSSVAHHGGTMRLIEYADLVGNLIKGREARNPVQPHPKVKIWGTQEARVKTADLVILGGLNDGVWPDLPSADPWLNRDLRRQAGMVAPERKVGLAAHDYQQAIAAPEVILSRALRDTEAETVPSRWLSRLTNLLKGVSEEHAKLLAQMQERGDAWVARAVLIEQPHARTAPAPRPSVHVPTSFRPRRVSISNIRKILDDPYALYAQKTLRLKPIPPLFPKPDTRLRGIVVHKIIELGLKQFNPHEEFVGELQRFVASARNEFVSQVAWPEKAAHWISLFESLAPRLLKAEIVRRAQGDIVATEEDGKLHFEPFGVDLICKADRIDRLHDDTFAIFDYKTSKPPTKVSMSRREKQLLLEAVIAENGGFNKIGPITVSKVAYLGVWREQGITEFEFKDGQVEQVRQDVLKLFDAFYSNDYGYVSRRYPMDNISGDYDQLARFGEWSDSDAPEKVDVS